MATYLIAWNPKKWHWDETNLKEAAAITQKGGRPRIRWSFGKTAKAMPGDRVYMIKLGQDPRGLVASGFVVSRPKLSGHYSDPGLPPQMYASIQLDYLVDGYKKVVIPREELDQEPFSKQHWDTQISGISIRPAVAAALENIWSERTMNEGGASIGEEKLGPSTYLEGGKLQILVNRYERDPKARAACIARFGYECSVCGTNLASIYGDTGAGLIHVHHIKPLSSVGKTKINPRRDLRPVCPNCHAVIHRGNPAFSIDDVKGFIKAAGRKRR